MTQGDLLELNSVFRDDDTRSDDGKSFETRSIDTDPRSGYNNDNDSAKDQSIGKEENRAVFYARLLVLALLLAVTGGVAWGVHYYVKSGETEDFEEDFDYSSGKVFDAVGSALDQSLGAIDNLMINMVSHQRHSGEAWPNVTIDDFAVKAAKILSQSKASLISTCPRVTGAQRAGWEAYAATHNQWVNESLRVQRKDPLYNGLKVDSWTETKEIHSNLGSRPEMELYYPTWQASPIVPLGASAYNWDVYVLSWRELNTVEKERSVVMGKTLNSPAPGNDDQLAQHHDTIEWISGLIGPELDPTEPLFPIYYPVVGGASIDVDIATEDPRDHEVVGIIAMTMFWRELMNNIQINGPDAVFLGIGDRHDPDYERFVREVYMHDLETFALGDRRNTYTGFPLSTSFCPYWMRLYPSDTMFRQHNSDNPLIFTLAAVGIFIFTSCVFWVYDCVSERRQKKVLQVAVESNAVVSSLFPQVVRDRIFPHSGSASKKHSLKLERIETAKLRLQQFLRQDGEDNDPSEHMSEAANPIAELFSETTVMFCDIAGFTAWSSVREPSQVFTLLETLYGSYDRLALRRGVFKVETIGDSYVAVAGLPDPRPDHAVVMAKFARDVREKTATLVKELGRTLGPDTGDLEVRIGLNSGPVTAGVLRGERSRFQLFGDTVNTAARLESSGVVSRIHISESTAKLLIKARKGHWVTKREDVVEAKGKGRIQTYWAEPSSSRGAASSKGDFSSENFQVMDEKTIRLVEWNVEIMTKLLKGIVLRREDRETMGLTKTRSGRKAAESTVKDKASVVATGTVLEEVKEVIMLPEFEPYAPATSQELDAIELSQSVVAQLREYISLVASLYRNNPFHSFEHASHVTMSVTKLLSRIVAPTEFILQSAQDGEETLASSLHDHTYGITSDPLTQFACVFSALIHDVDHQGVPNSQLVAENSPLVLTYKGKSLAEQNSVDISWRLLMEDQFEDMRAAICATKAELSHFRQLVVNVVMATDIMDKDLKALRNQRWDNAFSEGSRQGETMAVNTNRKATIVIEHLIQASDVAHTMQHWHIFRKWNERLFTEMWQAFKAGRAERNPAEFWYQGELGFFDFYIIPLAKKLSDCGVFGVSSDEYLGYATRNREEWENRGREVVASMLAKLEGPADDLGSCGMGLGEFTEADEESSEDDTSGAVPTHQQIFDMLNITGERTSARSVAICS